MTVEIIKGDARNLPLEDDSVDLIITSPPYFALRSYKDEGEHYDGQLGSEPTPTEFVDALIECTREMMRVLKPTGSLWINLGDKYVEKSLMGLPWRYAIRCIDELGLILRAEVIWSKSNGLPESVKDRVRRSHEQWFHFTLQPKYYSAIDEIREPHIYPNDARHLRSSGYGPEMTASINSPLNPLGKLPGSVWTINTEPLKVPAELGVDHFAAFPSEFPRKIINGWSPAAICETCGEGLRPVTSKEGTGRVDVRQEDGSERQYFKDMTGKPTGKRLDYTTQVQTTITGYACACPEVGETRPAVVLDPFGGTGTTATVAKALGRHGISVDLSSDYCRIAEWRTTDPRQIERVQNMQRYGTRTPTKKQIRDAST